MPYIPQGTDPWVVPNPQPGRHYRYISSKPERLSLWLRSYGDRPGYSLERGATVEDTKKIAVSLGLSEEQVDLNLNRIMYGHNVLASIPEEEYRKRTAEFAKTTNDKVGNAKEAFHAVGDDLPGITTFERTEEEHNDRKRIATRSDRPISGQTGRGTSPHLRTRARRASAR